VSIVVTDSPPSVNDAAEAVDGRSMPAGVGRRFAIFAAMLSAANLFLPWDVAPSVRHGPRVLHWWHMLLDHSLPDAVLLQVIWMGMTPVALLVAALIGALRHRGLLLLATGTVGLVTQGWCMMVGWEQTTINILDPGQLLIMVAVALMIGAALAGAQLRLSAVRPELRRQRWTTGLLGLTLLIGLVLFAAMLAGSPTSLILLLTPEGRAGGLSYGLIQSTAILIYAAIGLAAIVSLLAPLTPPSFSASVSLMARRVIHLPILLTPITVAIAGGGVGDGGPIVQFFTARIAAMYAIYWFALSLGGEVLLAVRYDAIEPDEEAF
jgi:hypothetical protein